MAPTLADVASAAGVSVSTASVAFSGAGPIAPETRDRVLAAAAQLGYAGPNPLGRSLRRGRSGIVGVVIGDRLRRSFRDPVSIQMLDGLARTLAAHGAGVLLIPSDHDEVDPLLSTAPMDAAVVVKCEGPGDEVVAELTRRGVPVVGMEGDPGPRGAAVLLRDQEGTADVTRHLLDLGHERIAVVSLPFGPRRPLSVVGLADGPGAAWLPDAEYPPTRNRLAGIADAGVRPVSLVETPASLVEHGHAAGLLALAAQPRPTAVIALSDLLASGVVLAARELGLRVPQDVSVVGFDGVDLPWLAPDVLTTVIQPLAEKGRAAADAAVRLAAGEEVADTLLPVELRIGTTSGPPPGR